MSVDSARAGIDNTNTVPATRATTACTSIKSTPPSLYLARTTPLAIVGKIVVFDFVPHDEDHPGKDCSPHQAQHEQID
jgi:hypothetical protein